VINPGPNEAFLAFGAQAPENGLTLSARGDLVEAAANLYAHLRALDATGAAVIAVAPIPAHGLGEAIRDRLARAAAPR
jgi:L-threonylcarbamoyladenylate synthase